MRESERIFFFKIWKLCAMFSILILASNVAFDKINVTVIEAKPLLNLQPIS